MLTESIKGLLCIFYVGGVSLLLFSAMLLCATELANLSDAIEKAREQSVLTQKILANYVMLGMHNSFQNTEETFNESIKLFEENMEALDGFATSKKAFINSEKIMEAWEPIKKSLGKNKSKAEAMVLFAQLDKMLILTRETTEIYTRQTGSMLGKIIDASADLGINAQRMATLYLLKAWGVKGEVIKQNMGEAIKTFQGSVEILKEAKINTEKILTTLKKVEKAFMYFTVMDALDNSSIPTLIYKKSNTILKNANLLSALYNKTITLN